MFKSLLPWKHTKTKVMVPEQTMEDEQVLQEQKLVPCNTCGRTFLPSPLKKHAPVCEKNAAKKRKVFDSLKQRVEGTDLAQFHQKSYLKRQESIPKPAEKVKKPSQWEESHQKLVDAIRTAKGAARDMSPTKKQTITTATNERCPHCERQFGPKAFDRHVEWCKEHRTRIQKSPANVLLAKERLEARTKYRVPPLNKSKKTTVKEKYSCGSIVQRTESICSVKSTPSNPLRRNLSVRKPRSVLDLGKRVESSPKTEKVPSPAAQKKVEVKSLRSKRYCPPREKINLVHNENLESITVSPVKLNGFPKKLVTWKEVSQKSPDEVIVVYENSDFTSLDATKSQDFIEELKEILTSDELLDSDTVVSEDKIPISPKSQSFPEIKSSGGPLVALPKSQSLVLKKKSKRRTKDDEVSTCDEFSSYNNLEDLMLTESINEGLVPSLEDLHLIETHDWAKTSSILETEEKESECPNSSFNNSPFTDFEADALSCDDLSALCKSKHSSASSLDVDFAKFCRETKEEESVDDVASRKEEIRGAKIKNERELLQEINEDSTSTINLLKLYKEQKKEKHTAKDSCSSWAPVKNNKMMEETQKDDHSVTSGLKFYKNEKEETNKTDDVKNFCSSKSASDFIQKLEKNDLSSKFDENQREQKTDDAIDHNERNLANHKPDFCFLEKDDRSSTSSSDFCKNQEEVIDMFENQSATNNDDDELDGLVQSFDRLSSASSAKSATTDSLSLFDKTTIQECEDDRSVGNSISSYSTKFKEEEDYNDDLSDDGDDLLVRYFDHVPPLIYSVGSDSSFSVKSELDLGVFKFSKPMVPVSSPYQNAPEYEVPKKRRKLNTTFVVKEPKVLKIENGTLPQTTKEKRGLPITKLPRISVARSKKGKACLKLKKEINDVYLSYQSNVSPPPPQYDPFISAERQLMELLECDSIKPTTTTTKPLAARPHTTAHNSVKTPAKKIVKSAEITNKKRASVIDPPACFQDSDAAEDEFEILENLINDQFNNENRIFSGNKQDKNDLNVILNQRKYSDTSSVDSSLINENDNLTIPEHFKFANYSPDSSEDTDITLQNDDVDLYSIQYDKKIEGMKENRSKTKTKIKSNFSGSGDAVKKRTKNVEAAGKEGKTPKAKGRDNKLSDSIDLDVTVKPEDLFAVDDKMYAEYKIYEEMYLKEKEQAANTKKHRTKNQIKSYGIDLTNDESTQTNKVSDDSAYGSLNRNSPKPRSSKLSPLRQRMDSASSSGSEIIPPPVSQQRMSRFCHECGNKYPVATAKFCPECGVKRLLL